MPEDDQLAARLARLHALSSGSSETAPHGKSSSHSSDSSANLKSRLNSLCRGKSRGEDVEQDYNARLALLLSQTEGGGESPSAEHLTARFSRLSEVSGDVGVASTTTLVEQPPHRMYNVPEDFAEEVQDLDDLFEAVVGEAGGGARHLPFDGHASQESYAHAKLSEIDALLKAEAARGNLDGSSALGGSAGAKAEEMGAEINKATEAFLGKATGTGREDHDDMVMNQQLGEEEERLLQMITDQVRLEGHGVVNRISPEAQGLPEEMWLPIAPTNRPKVSSALSIGMGHHHPTGNTGAEAGAAAERIAQQAMDEARLFGKGSGGAEAPSLSGKGNENQQKPRLQRDERQASCSWCCICSEDAALRCEQCEADSGQEMEPELFCARCFNEVHRRDPEMKAHRPRPVAGAQGRDGRQQFRLRRNRKETVVP